MAFGEPYVEGAHAKEADVGNHGCDEAGKGVSGLTGPARCALITPHLSNGAICSS